MESECPAMIKLKWEIKKFNSETANLYKEYKVRLIEIFQNNTIIPIMRSEMS